MNISGLTHFWKNMASWYCSYFLFATLASVTAYGPFYGNKDLMCNRGTPFACYCSTVTWRRFDRTDAPLCSQLFPRFEAAVLELASCDVQLEDNPYSHANGDDDGSSGTFERYFKRTLATLIRRKCQQEPNEPACENIPQDLSEEHIVFTAYQCSKDLLTSRLWMVVVGRQVEEETKPQQKRNFVEGSSLARVLTAPSVWSELNPHLFGRRSRVIDIFHDRLDNAFVRPNEKEEDASSSIQHPAEQQPANPDRNDLQEGDNEDYEENRDDPSAEGIVTTKALVEPEKFNWVAVLIGVLFVTYFVTVWIISIVFCLRNRREIRARNNRKDGDMRNGSTQENRSGQTGVADASTTKKLMSRDEESEYDNL